jgi:N-methylhydantoinase A
MEIAARDTLARAGVPPARRAIARAADLRYRRQAYELTVPMADGPVTATTMARLAADFHDKHRMTYGHASPDEPVQLVNLRVSAVGRLDGLALGRGVLKTGGAAPSVRPVYFKETGLAACEVLPRDALAPGLEKAGPLIVEAADTTIVVPPGWRLRARPDGFIMLEAPGHA